MPDTTVTEQPKRLQCRHIFNNGHRCGAVCLRTQEFCYYHHSTRGRALRNQSQSPAEPNDNFTFDLPLLEDRSAIQTSIGLVLQRIAANQLDPRRAGLLLYGLQIASLNLPKEQHDPDRITPPPVDEVILHPELGPLAPEAELPPPYRSSREQLIDWQTRDLTRRETELSRREQQLNEREAKVRAVERSQSAIVPDIKAVAEEFIPTQLFHAAILTRAKNRGILPTATKDRVPHPSRTHLARRVGKKDSPQPQPACLIHAAVLSRHEWGQQNQSIRSNYFPSEGTVLSAAPEAGPPVLTPS